MTALPSFRRVFVFCPCSAWLSAVLHITHVSDFEALPSTSLPGNIFRKETEISTSGKKDCVPLAAHVTSRALATLLYFSPFSLSLMSHLATLVAEKPIDFKVRKFSVDEEWAGEEDLKVRHCVQTIVRQEEEVCTSYYSGGCNNQQECRAHPRRARGGISNIPTTKKWWNIWGDGYDNCSSLIFAQDERTGIKVEDFTALGSKFYTHLVHTINICQVNQLIN